jgi:hypothetical protein
MSGGLVLKSVLNQRSSRAWSVVLALLACIAAASPAHAQTPTVVTPSISGSGTLTSNATNGGSCATANRPNGAVTACNAFVSFSLNAPTPITVTASPQATPPGHWRFARWEGTTSCAATSLQCTFFGPGHTPRAVFEDVVGPSVALPAGSGPAEGALQVGNTATFEFSANETGTLQCRLDGAEFGTCSSPTALTGLAPGNHRFDIRGIDLSGNVGAIVSRTWAVAAPDLDSDGFNSLIDCNDTDPGIRPGALELNDNAVDENCDGVLGTTPAVNPNARVTEQVIVTLAFFANAKKTTTKFTTLQVKNVPLGATVTVTCKGKGCPSGLKDKGFTKTNAFGTVTLAKFIKKSLRKGDKITVVVAKQDAISAVKILTVRASKKPLIATKCQPPGARSPVAC